MFRPLLVADHLGLATASRVLISGATISLGSADRATLVGRNGSGKSTLLQVIAACALVTAAPTHAEVTGHIQLAPHIRVGYLPQTPPDLGNSLSVAEHLAACGVGPARAQADYERAAAALERSADAGALSDYSAAVEAMNRESAWDFADRHAQVVQRLLGPIDGQQPMSQLSGGQATVVALVGLMLATPDLLLLDEPTNNLDVAATAFLGELLASSQSAVLMVSHDRVFLDAVATAVLEIDEHDGSLHHHNGNYSEYLRLRAEHTAAAQRAYLEHQRQRALLQLDARRISGSAQRFDSISSNDYRRSRGAKLARRAVVMKRRLERDIDSVPEPKPPHQPRIVVGECAAAEGTLLQLRGAAAAFGGVAVLAHVELAVRARDRILLMGANGSGKTTLLRLMDGSLATAEGQVQRAPELTLSRLNQMPPAAAGGESCIDYARRLAPISAERAGEILGKVLFGDVSNRAIGEFSVGERRRVELAVLFAAPPPLMLLDEPTNHLDLLTLDMLDSVLADYRGALVVVSHDQWLMQRLRATRVLEICDGVVHERDPATVLGA